MIVVISPDRKYANEAYWINMMLDQGLDLYHIRKPYASILDVLKIYKDIESCFLNRIVFHANDINGCVFDGFRVHINTRLRNIALSNPVLLDYVVSTSTHSIEEFNGLAAPINNAFLGPFYDSISKFGYRASKTLMYELKDRINYDTGLIAIGGINDVNIAEIYPQVDGVALMGAIWQADNPLTSFLTCKRKIDHLS